MQYLVFLACPITMGAMMWMMGRGKGTRPAPSTDGARIATLEQELRELRERHDVGESREPELSSSQR